MIPIVAVIGPRRSGKTKVVEALARHFASRNLKVGTIKHIPHEGFSIDTPGKDTWRHSQAGASVVASLAPSELAIIKRRETSKASLDDLVQELGDVDVVIIEGLKSLVKERSDAVKVLTAPSEASAIEWLKELGEAHAIVGPKEREVCGIPCVSIESLPELVNELLKPAFQLRKLLDALPKMDCRLCGSPDCLSFARKVVEGQRILEDCPVLSGKASIIEVDGKKIPLNPFVREVVRSTVLGLVSTLKGVKIKGDESVHVRILKPSELSA